MLRSAFAALTCASLLLLTGCDEDNAVSVRLRLRPDLSGTIVTSALSQPAGPDAVEQSAVGASFDTRVQLNGGSGRFPALSGLKLGDITFAGGTPEGGLRWVKVEVPGGAEARWPGVFMPLSEAERMTAADAFDPSGGSRDVGKVLKIEIELPSAVIGNGATGKVRGTKNTSDGSTATLVVPIAALREGKEPLVWHVTW